MHIDDNNRISLSGMSFAMIKTEPDLIEPSKTDVNQTIYVTFFNSKAKRLIENKLDEWLLVKSSKCEPRHQVKQIQFWQQHPSVVKIWNNKTSVSCGGVLIQRGGKTRIATIRKCIW